MLLFAVVWVFPLILICSRTYSAASNPSAFGPVTKHSGFANSLDTVVLAKSARIGNGPGGTYGGKCTVALTYSSNTSAPVLRLGALTTPRHDSKPVCSDCDQELTHVFVAGVVYIKIL